ncbi:MAG: DUF885 domain-containing protein [Actinobacteria bacterium]|nr:DUF885 domain-containing protein [Actinomycetota bacterium]
MAQLADQYVERFAALDPVEATDYGIKGHESEMTDYSPDGIAARAEDDRATLAAIRRVDRRDDRDRIAAESMQERLSVRVDQYDEGERLRDLRVIGSPVQAIRQCFDLMPYETDEDWHHVAMRLGNVPAAIASLRAALEEGVRRNVVAAQRQAIACAQQAATWGGEEPGGGRPFFFTLVDRYDAAGTPEGALRATLARNARAATEAYADFARYLRDEYAPKADPRDPVGAQRYATWAESFTGTKLDLEETYAWGWDELHRIEAQMAKVAERILPGASVPEVIEHLERDPARAIDGVDNLRRWLQDLMDRTIAELDGVHFDIPEPVKRVEAMIAPPGGAAAMYYTGPSEDFSRPGRTWYPTLGKTRFPLWGEVSIAYHEGVPGHHLQVAQVVYLADRLTRFQRTLGWTSGHGEGWALYAERLMGELGYLDVPDYELGMLRAQAMRSVRVVVDIGMHLELPIPAHERYHPGERWTPELALPFVIERSYFPPEFMASEVDRYLGWPGQAISYKVGERIWLQARDDARARHGRDFDLKAFHAAALDLGPLGLDQLRRELARV